MERVTEGIRDLIGRLDRSLDGEGEAPTVNEWCETAWISGGHAPLEPAGEYVCECLRDGDRVFPKWGNEVCERVVRCADCAHWQNSLCWRQAYDATDELGNDYVECVFHTDARDFCSMGELREG